MTPYLSVRDLRVVFDTEEGPIAAVDGLSFDLEQGRTLAIVGESGSGKSTAAMALLGLHDQRRTETGGSIRLGGTDLTGARERDWRSVRGRLAAMIFQDALSALSPFYTVGEQIAETYRRHTGASRAEARARAITMLDKVGIPEAKQRAGHYPHQFSGGMRQRAMIAVALVCDPALLIADEPTTALDVTVQAQILELIGELREASHTAVILVTHDLGVVAGNADDVLVMYAGRCVEYGTVDQVLTAPEHPYTWGLLRAVPDLHGDPTTDLKPIPGTPPSLLAVPDGCAFAPRCRFPMELEPGLCATHNPEPADAARRSACHLGSRARSRLLRADAEPGLTGLIRTIGSEETHA